MKCKLNTVFASRPIWQPTQYRHVCKSGDLTANTLPPCRRLSRLGLIMTRVPKIGTRVTPLFSLETRSHRAPRRANARESQPLAWPCHQRLYNAGNARRDPRQRPTATETTTVETQHRPTKRTLNRNQKRKRPAEKEINRETDGHDLQPLAHPVPPETVKPRSLTFDAQRPPALAPIFELSSQPQATRSNAAQLWPGSKFLGLGFRFLGIRSRIEGVSPRTFSFVFRCGTGSTQNPKRQPQRLLFRWCSDAHPHPSATSSGRRKSSITLWRRTRVPLSLHAHAVCRLDFDNRLTCPALGRRGLRSRGRG